MNDKGLSLADLIRRERDASGASYMDIAKRSGLSKAKIGQLAMPDSRYQVRADTIEKLAVGLRLPIGVVQRAAMVTAGIADGEGGSRSAQVELMVAQLLELDDRALDMIAAMIDAAVRKGYQRG